MFGFTDIKDIIPAGPSGQQVIEKLRTAGNGDCSLIRLLPTYRLANWGYSKAAIGLFQQDEVLEENIRKIRDYFNKNI